MFVVIPYVASLHHVSRQLNCLCADAACGCSDIDIDIDDDNHGCSRRRGSRDGEYGTLGRACSCATAARCRVVVGASG
jgi:hypothetical protein